MLLITDAGMPSVSDPGYTVVRACVDAGLPVTCLPGPSAVTTALALSALPAERFCFDGFAPRKPGARRAWLAELIAQPAPQCSSPAPARRHPRLRRAGARSERRAAVCRELTKTHEQVRRGALAELAIWAADGCAVRSPSSSRVRRPVRANPTCRRSPNAPRNSRPAGCG